MPAVRVATAVPVAGKEGRAVEVAVTVSETLK